MSSSARAEAERARALRLDPSLPAMKAIGVPEAELAEYDEAEKISGYQVGGISPFAMRRQLPAVIEESLLALDRIIVNGGRRGVLHVPAGGEHVYLTMLGLGADAGVLEVSRARRALEAARSAAEAAAAAEREAQEAERDLDLDRRRISPLALHVTHRSIFRKKPRLHGQ